MSKYNQQEFI